MVLTVRPGNGGGAPRDVRLQRQPIAFSPVEWALCGSSGEAAGGGGLRALQARAGSTAMRFATALAADAANGCRCCCCCAGGLAPTDPDSKLGYVRIATFSKQTTEKVQTALKELQQGVSWAGRP